LKLLNILFKYIIKAINILKVECLIVLLLVINTFSLFEYI